MKRGTVVVMATVITFGLQKGGVSKTTTTGVFAHFLSQDGYKVLAIDMDSQGNLTELLTDEPANEFILQSSFEAIVYREPEKYIVNVSDNLDLIPGNNMLALFPRWLYTNRLPDNKIIKRKGEVWEQLDSIVDKLRDKYDFILIDTPPSLSEQTTNSMFASDYVFMLFEGSRFCYSAVPNFMETINTANNISHHKPTPLGILRTLNDSRRSDPKYFNDKIAEDFPDLVFETIITRKAAIGRLSLFGFNDNIELEKALEEYREAYNEFLERIEGKMNE